MTDQPWQIWIEWRNWTFGLVFGPEVWGIRLGPLWVGYVPEFGGKR